MEKFSSLTGIAAPFPGDDVNTDQIAPVTPGRALNPNYGDILFSQLRRNEDGSEKPDFLLNRAPFRAPSILVTGRNFGCGSSRESAVWALMAIGIRCLVAKSFADFFRENCLQNGVLPILLDEAEHAAFAARVIACDGAEAFTVDLVAQRITGPGGGEIAFEIGAADRTRLLEGLDDIGLTLKHAPEIAAWEKRMAAAQPWLQQARDRRLA